MAKKHPSPSARMLLEKIYAEEGQGIEPGKLANCLHELNETMGIGEPRTILVQNLDPREPPQYHDNIAPGEYGVTNQRNYSKFFKRVNVAANVPSSEATKKEGKSSNG